MRASIRLIVTALLTVTPAVAASPDQYTVDPDRSELVVRLFKGGVASGLAHDHVIRATIFDGTIRWNPEQPTDAVVEVRADARSLVVDEPELRAKYALEGELEADKRQQVTQTMESAKQLDVATFPELAFLSRSVRDVGDGTIEVTGELTLHGTSRTVRFITTPTLEAGVLTASAEFDFLQSDFGIKPYSAVLGAVKVQDSARFAITLVAAPAPPEDTAAEEASAVSE